MGKLWPVYWRANYEQRLHGRVTMVSKKAAIESAKEHDNEREYAWVTHPDTLDTVFECGNHRCYELPSVKENHANEE